MMKLCKPRCPYCGKKVNYANTWVLKTQGEYLCPKCGGISNIVLDRGVYFLAFLAILASSAFFLLSFLKFLPFDFWLFLLVILPFFLFFLISVFLVRLKKPGPRRAPPPEKPVRGSSSGRGRR